MHKDVRHQSDSAVLRDYEEVRNAVGYVYRVKILVELQTSFQFINVTWLSRSKPHFLFGWSFKTCSQSLTACHEELPNMRFHVHVYTAIS